MAKKSAKTEITNDKVELNNNLNEAGATADATFIDNNEAEQLSLDLTSVQNNGGDSFASKKDLEISKTKHGKHAVISESVIRYNPSVKTGLSDEEVEGRNLHGLINYSKKKYSKSYLSIFLGNFLTFFNLLGLLVTIALASVGAPLRSFFFVCIYILNIAIGIIQEIRAKLCIDRLSLLTSKTTIVIRNGAEKEIFSKEIVLDDIVLLKLGNQVSTDCIIREGEVEVNESLLTGESVAVKKSIGDSVLAGSFITSGSCYAKAVKVGKDNYIEILSNKAKKYKKPHSELMNSLRMFITVIGVIIVPLAVAMFFKTYSSDIGQTVMSTSTVIIGMIPSGMFLLTSMALAVGVIRLARHNTLVQDLYSLEMLARVDTLCLDKTGTITDGRMKVNDVVLLNNSINYTITEIMGSMLCALHDNNQTSVALNNHFGQNGTLKPVSTIPFNSKIKLSAVTFYEAGTFAIGAPEFVVKDINEKTQNLIKQYASMGLRVLMLAQAKGGITKDGSLPQNFKPIALITITDNIREDAVSTIRWFKENDVAIKIISGDNPVTVAEVARRVGVENADKYISLEGLSERDVIAVANNYTVFGRVTPEQKAVLLKTLKISGHTTAMMGDGVNDILALKEADCAISVASGSEAARNISHLVLMDNNFNSMPKIVHEGRRVINNIQSSASLYLMKTMFTMLLSIIMLCVPTITQYPLSLANMILLEVFVIGVPSFFLSLQANDARVKDNFIRYVISKSVPGALLMVFSVMTILGTKLLFGQTYADLGDGVYSTMMVYAVTYAGAVMLFRICLPFNTYRATLFFLNLSCILAVTVVGIIQGVTMFEITLMSPILKYWHHILIVFAVVLIDIPLSKCLQIICDKIRLTSKTKK